MAFIRRGRNNPVTTQPPHGSFTLARRVRWHRGRPVDGVIHHLAHAGEPPTRPRGVAAPSGHRLVTSCSGDSKFHLPVDHMSAFRFSPPNLNRQVGQILSNPKIVQREKTDFFAGITLSSRHERDAASNLGRNLQSAFLRSGFYPARNFDDSLPLLPGSGLE